MLRCVKHDLTTYGQLLTPLNTLIIDNKTYLQTVFSHQHRCGHSLTISCNIFLRINTSCLCVHLCITCVADRCFHHCFSSQWHSSTYSISLFTGVNVRCWWSCLRGTGCQSWWRSSPRQDSHSSTRTRWRKSRRSASMSLTVIVNSTMQYWEWAGSLNCCVFLPERRMTASSTCTTRWCLSSTRSTLRSDCLPSRSPASSSPDRTTSGRCWWTTSRYQQHSHSAPHWT